MMKTFISWPVRILRRMLRPFYYLEKALFAKGIISSKEMIFPDFLCIGVQKTGTSWLYENLRIQSEIFMPDRKELDYFSNPHRFYSYPLSHYSDYFTHAKNKIKGEASPYCDLPIKRIRFIRNIMPEVKLIIILRNPVDRIWSAGLMHLVRARQRKFNEIQESEFLHFLERNEIFQQGVYSEILKNWRAIFPKEQLLIVFYDDLVNNPKLFLQNILRFIGADYTVSTYINDRVNESPRYPMPESLRSHFLELYRPSIIELSKEFGVKASVWLKNSNF